MLQELVVPVLGETLAKLITETAQFLGSERLDHPYTGRDPDLELATWFNTYQLTEDTDTDPLPQSLRIGIDPDVLKAALILLAY